MRNIRRMWGFVYSKKRLLFILAAFFLLVGAMAALCIYFGVFWPNTPPSKDYPVRGVDVSMYQGEIDWDILAQQNIHFAFIKATEGSTFRDKMFDQNWKNASKTRLRIGAYHFFSFDSAGKTQAENFIAAVPRQDGMLPPVVDIEFYGGNEKNPPQRKDAQATLNELLVRLEAYYGMKPILYATQKSYQLYLKGEYTEYDIWIRSIFTSPSLPDERKWTFWQYSNRGRLEGYSGEEKYIDQNVFCGTSEEFAVYGQ